MAVTSQLFKICFAYNYGFTQILNLLRTYVNINDCRRYLVHEIKIHFYIMALGTIYDTAYKGDFNQVKVRIDQDRQVLLIPDPNKRLLVHWAALGGNENLVEFLIESGSPVDPVDDTDVTPLILAASAGHYKVVRVLIGKGANIHKASNRGQTALLYACSKGHKEVVDLLIEAGANVNHADILGATALHRAAAQGRTNIIDTLLSSGMAINVNAQDCTGSTPLHLACEEDREAVAVSLMKAGADPFIQNKDKKAALDLCSPKLKKSLSTFIV